MTDIEINNASVTQQDGRSRASADFNGTELFFDTADAQLEAAPEAFASALLPVAVLAGERLVVDEPVDPLWVRNVARILSIWHTWWGTEADIAKVLVADIASPREPRSQQVGLCFSLGVDSFFSLLRSGRRIDVVIAVEGFDVPLGDEARMAPIDAAVRDVAASLDIEPVVMRTNLRDHPSYPPLEWERTHGGALAALGQLSRGFVGELVISSTKPSFAIDAWGSHWETDPLWSSAWLEVAHVGADYRRHEKVKSLVDEPLVQRHLRVCWENRRPVGNCGECEKCVRTMLLVSSYGTRADFRTFPTDTSLRESVDALPPLPPFMRDFYAEVLVGLHDPELVAAVERLLARSQPPA